MAKPLHTVAETPQFIRDAAGAGLTADEHRVIVDVIASNPTAGDEVRGSGGIRKVRIAGRGKGKSGGYRLMAAYFGTDAPVYLLALLSKGERANFSDQEIRGFKSLTAEISLFWRRRNKK